MAKATVSSTYSQEHQRDTCDIDTTLMRPNTNACIQLGSGVRLAAGDEVITFARHSLEPGNGFHIFSRAIPFIQRLRPNVHIVIVGESEVSQDYLLPREQITVNFF